MHKYNDIRDVSELARTTYEYELMSLEDLFSLLVAQYREYSDASIELLEKAFEFGKNFHEGQLRKSGAPYFTHPLIVAILLVKHQPDQDMLIATLLHDVIEDTDATNDDLKIFGPKVLEMIDGLTKISQSHTLDEKEGGNLQEKLETIRKILQFGERDMRILVIKVFDRLHNILTLFWKQNLFSTDRYLKQTQDIYIPIAKRIGLRDIYHDFLFHVNYYQRSQRFHRILDALDESRESIKEVTTVTENYLGKATKTKIISVKFYERNLFSLDTTKDPADFTLDDMYFIEIVVPNRDDCYGLLEDLNSPQDMTLIPVGAVRDYISRPKLSRYRALQLGAIIKGKSRIRIHILSQQMYEKRLSYLPIHELQEIYGPVLFRDFDLIDEATKSNSDKFIQAVMGHVFAKKMQIHNPQKNEVYVPYNFTALDAAIYLFPDKIAHIKSIKVNQEKVGLSTLLHSNDIIEVKFSKSTHAQPSWIRYLQSETSKFRLQALLKREDQEFVTQSGEGMLQDLFDKFHLGKASTTMDRESLKRLGQSPQQVYQMLGQGSMLPMEVIEGLGKTKRASIMKLLIGVLKNLPFVTFLRDIYRPYIRFSFHTNEPSPHRLTRDLYRTCMTYDVVLQKISCKRTHDGSVCKVYLTADDKKNLYEAFLEVTASDHVVHTYVHLKKRFKLKIAFLLIFAATFWLSLYAFIPWFSSQDHLSFLVYISVLPPLIANALMYHFCMSYFSSWRHNKKLLMIVTGINIVGISIFSWLMFEAGLDTYDFSLFFPVVVILISTMYTIMLFYRGDARAPSSTIELMPGDKSYRKKIEGYVIRLGAVIIWGIQPIFFRYYVSTDLEVSTRMPLLFLGMVSCSLVVLLVYWLSTKNKSSIQWSIPINIHFFSVSFGLIALYYLYIVSLNLTTSTNVILLNNFAPVFTLIIALTLWRGEYAYLRSIRYIRQIFFIFIIGGIGSTLLFFNDIRSEVASNVRGNVIALFAMVVDIFYVVGQIRYVKSMGKRLTPYIVLTISFGAFVLSLPFLFLTSFEGVTFTTIGPSIFAGVLVAVGLILNLEAFKRIDGFIAHLMFNISILITFFLEAFFLSEIVPSGLIIVSILLIMGASFLAELVNIKAQREYNN